MSERGETIRVLHVDDDPSFGDVVSAFLEREDDRITVRTAASADEGLELLTDHDVDCIVSDYDMPGQNGIEFLRVVRERFPDRPFILYTGKGSEEVASEAIYAGVTDYLQKETGTDQYTVLANRITNAVESYRSQRTLTEQNHTLRRYERMINSMGEAACIYDVNGRFEIVNEYLADWYGTTPEELEGETSALIPSIRARAEGEPYRELLDGDREDVYGEIEAEFPGHGDAVLEYRLTPLKVDGEIDGVVAVARDITERKERERWLQETTSRLEALFERSPDMINIHDPEGNIIEPNPAFVEKTGYSEAELTNMKVWEIDQEMDPGKAETLWSGMDYGDSERLEGRYRRKDGSTFPVEVHIRRLDLDGADRFVVISRDITERKESERKREQIIDRMNDAVIEVDADWEITLVNERTEEFSGEDESALLGRDFWDVFPEVQGTRFEETYREAMRTREPASVVGYYSGVDEWFDIDVYPNDDGGLAFYFLTVTEHQERKQELEEANQLLSTVFETLPVGVTVLNTDGRIVQANQRAEEVLGLTESDMNARAYNDPEWEIFGEDGDPIPDENLPFAQVRATGESVYDYEHGITWPDGKERWLSINAAPITTDGGIEQVVTAITDITDSREYERAIERQNDRLSEFTSIVSHDLRNPLNVAEGRLELAREGCDSEHLDAVERAHGRMDALISDLLALAREGETTTDITSVELTTLAETCWQNVDTAEATLVADLQGTVRADESRLSQLFENLVRNAIEHGGADVTVTVGELPDGFYIEDDGPGIPEDERADVFEVGYSTSEQGTGFGLGIVEQVVDAHGWEIRLTDGSEGGARFEITGVEFVADQK